MSGDGQAGRHRCGSNDVLVAGLMRGLTLRDAAPQAGMSERTARRRGREPEGMAALRSLEGRVAGEISAGLTALSADALQALAALLADTSPPSVRLRAASTVLTLALRYRDSEDTQRRLTELEDARAELTAILSELRASQGGQRS